MICRRFAVRARSPRTWSLLKNEPGLELEERSISGSSGGEEASGPEHGAAAPRTGPLGRSTRDRCRGVRPRLRSEAEPRQEESRRPGDPPGRLLLAQFLLINTHTLFFDLATSSSECHGGARIHTESDLALPGSRPRLQSPRGIQIFKKAVEEDTDASP